MEADVTVNIAGLEEGEVADSVEIGQHHGREHLSVQGGWHAESRKMTDPSHQPCEFSTNVTQARYWFCRVRCFCDDSRACQCFSGPWDAAVEAAAPRKASV